MRRLQVVAACGVILLATGLIWAWHHAGTKEQRSAVSALAYLLVLYLSMAAFLRKGLSPAGVLEAAEAGLVWLCKFVLGVLRTAPVLLLFGALGFWSLESFRGWVGAGAAMMVVICALLLFPVVSPHSDGGKAAAQFIWLILVGTLCYWLVCYWKGVIP